MMFLFVAETREAQVRLVCDIFRKWGYDNRGLEREHPGVGER